MVRSSARLTHFRLHCIRLSVWQSERTIMTIALAVRYGIYDRVLQRIYQCTYICMYVRYEEIPGAIACNSEFEKFIRKVKKNYWAMSHKLQR